MRNQSRILRQISQTIVNYSNKQKVDVDDDDDVEENNKNTQKKNNEFSFFCSSSLIKP